MSMENRHLIETGDGSHSLYVPELDEPYHSRHGAVPESLHVFIEMGLAATPPDRAPLRILEIGLGTGLNALLTLDATEREVHYTAVEAYPVTAAEAAQLNYPDWVADDRAAEWLDWVHRTEWEVEVRAADRPFTLLKLHADGASVIE